MSKFCFKCGDKFKQLDAYCPNCGEKRITKKEGIRFTNSHSSVPRVFILQVLFFFIYPFIYFYNLNRKLKIKSKAVVFSYNWSYLLIILIILGILLRYATVLISGFPSEDSSVFILSNVLILGPYVVWFLLFIFLYLFVLFRSIVKINRLLSPEYRIKYLLAFFLGVAYVQYKINKLSSSKTRVYQSNRIITIQGYNLVILSSLLLIALLSLTPPGKRLWVHANAITGSYSTDMEQSGLDFKGKYYLLKSNPVRTSMDHVAEVCENDPDINLSLGCNVEIDGKFNIYISQVNEPVLRGIEKYSIVHEMLHTAYAKLSPEEKTKINAAIQEQYPMILASQDTIILNAIKPYDVNDLELINNELHSILPIFLGDLGEPLESYYNGLFKNRSKLAQEYRTSERVLIDAESAVKSWEAPLKKAEEDLNKGYELIESQKNDLDYYERIGNIYAFNSIVPTYNSNVDLYNSRYAAYEKIFEGYTKSYDSYVSLYNSLRRNITYQEASLTANKQIDKIE